MSNLTDPRTKYPVISPPEQEQQHPGLEIKADPVPDLGMDDYKGSGKLEGRKALITGGDSGIGAATAIAYAREGADVAIAYLPEEQPDADRIIKAIEDAGRKAVAIPGDLTDEAFCRDLVAQAVDRLGGLDILVNNAGYQQFVKDLADLSEEQFDRTMKTNIYAHYRITKEAVPHLPAGASIIITASVQAVSPSGGLFDYAQTKAANVAYAKALAEQLSPKGIRVNAVAPGPFWTPLQVTGGQPTEKLPQFGADTPLGRAGQPVEIAPVYVALAAGDMTYSSGQLFGASGATGKD